MLKMINDNGGLLEKGRIVNEVQIIRSFCGGPGGGFFKKSPLAAGGTPLRGDPINKEE